MAADNTPRNARFLKRPGTAAIEAPAPTQATREAGRPIKQRRQRRQLSDGRVPVQAYIMPEGLRELKRLALDEDRPYTDLIAEAVDDVLAKYGRPQVARPAPE
jgi:hypothetical protein